MFNDMYSTVLPTKDIRKTKQLIKWMYNYSSNKQYSCELYIHTNPLSWVTNEVLRLHTSSTEL